jgi:SPP1 family predicted phage head-tail adaptor
MRAPSTGSMNKRVTIQSRSATIDGEGGQVNTWSDVATVWASIRSSFGAELTIAQSLNIDQPSTICIRWQASLSDQKQLSAKRLVCGSRIFNIKSSYNIDENNHFIVMLCSEGLNNG